MICISKFTVASTSKKNIDGSANVCLFAVLETRTTTNQCPALFAPGILNDTSLLRVWVTVLLRNGLICL